MFDELSVAENIFMGHMPGEKPGFVDWPQMRQRSAELLKSIEADFDPEDKLKRFRWPRSTWSRLPGR